jgi:peroxiredoxin
MKRAIGTISAVCVAVLVSAVASASPTTRPSTELQVMSDAYSRLKTLSVSGTISLSAQINGQKIARQADFTGAYGGANRYRHEVKQDVISSCDGEKIYVFHPSENLYSEQSAPDDGTLPDDVRRLLASQDLSLALALSGDAAMDLLAGSTASATTPDGTIRISYPDRDVTLTLDPATHLIRHVTTDETRALSTRGADVKTALIDIDYTASKPDAAIPAEALAFTPPATADAEQPPAAAQAATDLTGKPAPSFGLDKLGGGHVSDSDLKGSVYILDFWATWCGPCRESLPGLDDIYKQRKAAGLKVFAVNQQEDAATVAKFVHDTGLSIPVLLDTDGKVGSSYGATAIPQTVVIGRDGNVRAVFVGSGNEQGIAAAADDALHAQAQNSQ